MPNLSPIGHKRILTMYANFREILTMTPGGDWAAKEDDLVQTIIPLMPDASDRMRRIAIRLMAFFVSDINGLLMTLAPQQFSLLKHYEFGIDGNPEHAEGESLYWLFEVTTDRFSIFEDAVSPGMSAFFYRSEFLPLAMRAWLRLQACHFDMGHLDLMSKIVTAAAAAVGESRNDLLFRVSPLDLGAVAKAE